MYLNPHDAMELLQITTRQGLYKIVTNNSISFKSQGAGKPNLYLKSDIENYKINNAKNIKTYKKKIIIKKVEKKVKDIEAKKNKNIKLKKETKKILKIDKVKSENFTEVRGKENIKKAIEDFVEEKLDEEIEPKKPTAPTSDEMQNPLNHIGKDEFNRVTDILIANGTYKEQDRALVLAYAISYQKYIYAVSASAMEDDTTSDQFGNLKVHPYFTVADRCLGHMLKASERLGIGVRSRIGLEIKQPKKETIFDMINQDEEFD